MLLQLLGHVLPPICCSSPTPVFLLVLLFTNIAYGLRVSSEQYSFTPWKQATARKFGAGDDTISIAIRYFLPDGTTLFSDFAMYGRVHENKVNGGRAYTRYISFDADIPDTTGPFYASMMLVNMANPKRDVIENMLVAMDRGLALSVPAEGRDLIDHLHIDAPRFDTLLRLPGLGVDGGSLLNRFADQLKNADGPVWYHVVKVDPGKGAHEVDGRRTVTGMTRNAVYEVDWKIRVH